jgi:hypothetical protein
MGEARAISRACSAAPSCRLTSRISPSAGVRSAAREAPALRRPRADPGQPACRQTSPNQFPKLSFTRGRPDSETRKVKSPVAVAAASGGRIGSKPARLASRCFSARMVITPSRTCCRPTRIGDSHGGANMIQASCWEEASMDGEAIFGGSA